MTTLFTFEGRDRGLADLLEGNRRRVTELNRELRKTREGTAEFSKLAGQLNTTRQTVSELSAEQRKLAREMSASKFPKDSLVNLRIEYAKLTDQIVRLSKAEAESAAGQKLIKKARELRSEINKTEESFGRFTGSVGNYRKALSSIGDIATGVFLGGGIFAAVSQITQAVRDGIDGVKLYSKALAELQAITGVTDEALGQLEEKANELTTIFLAGGGEIVNKASDIFDAMKLVGSAAPSLLEDADALAEVTKNAIILSKASGDDLATSVSAITTIMGQFNLEASQSGEIVNILAAGSKLGAEEVPGLAESIRIFGVSAKGANVNIAESVALVETLAERQLKGAQAGTQLRNVLLKISAVDALPKKALDSLTDAGVSLEVLGDNSLSLETRLRELSKIQGDAGAIARVFGVENVNAAAVLIDNVDTYARLTEEVQGTNTAFEQAAVNAKSLASQFENFSARTENALINTLRELAPEIETVLDLAGTGVEIGVDLLSLLVKIPGLISDNKTEVLALAVAYAAWNKEAIFASLAALKNTQAYALLTSAQARATLSTNVLSTAQKAMPILAVVSAIYILVKAFQAYEAGVTATEKAVRRVSDASKEIAESVKEEMSVLNQSISVLQDVTATTEEREKAIKKLTDQYPEYLKGINLEIQTSEQLAVIQRELTDQMIRRAAEQQKANATAEVSAKIVQKQLEIQRLEDKRDRGGFSFQDLDFIIANESQKLQQLRDQLVATGKEFDRVFKLDQDPESSVLTIVMPEREQNQIDLRKKTIAELEAIGTAAAKAEIQRREEVQRKRRSTSKAEIKDEQALIVGTIGFLEEQIKKLKEALERTPEPGIGKVIAELSEKERELESLRKKIEEIRKSTDRAFKLRLEIESGGLAEAPAIDAGSGLSGIVIKSEQAIADEKARIKKEELKTRAEQEKDALKQAKDLADKAFQEQKDRAEKEIEQEAEKWENIKNLATSAIASISSAVFDIQAQRRDAEEKETLSAIDKEYDKRIKKAAGNDKLIAKLEADREKEKERIQKDAAKKRQQQAVTESIIQTALAVVEALPNYFLAAAVGIAGLAQTAVIASQQFAFGGFTEKKRQQAKTFVPNAVSIVKKSYNVGGFTGPGLGPVDETGQRQAGYIMKPWGKAVYHGNEFIASDPMVRKYRPLFEQIDAEQKAYFGRPFASGGFTALDVGNAAGRAGEPLIVSTEFSTAMLLKMGAIIGEQVAARTGAEVRDGLAKGIGDSSRRLEREKLLSYSRKV